MNLARALGVGSLVEGSVEGSGDRIVVTVQLVDGETGMHERSERIEGQGEDLLALRDSIVQQATRLVGQAVGRELRAQRRRATFNDAKAWDLYQRAQHLVEDADTLLWALGDTLSARHTLLRADSLLALASEEDPRWTAPIVARGWIARTRAGLYSASSTTRDRDLLEEGLGLAEAALRIDETDPEALELRGSIGVDLYRLPDAGASDDLARRAEEDLRVAAVADPSRVFARISLADLLRIQGKFEQASIEAQHALDADPFLINAEKEILFTLSQIWLDLGEVERANEFIDAGRRRFPFEPAFPAAKLVLLAGRGGMSGAVDTAYVLLDQLEDLFGVPVWTYGRLQVAAVLAQHGMADSAQAVVEQAWAAGADRSWSRYFEANVRLHLGEEEEALDLLGRYLSEFPQRRAYIARDWWWEPLREHPRFREMVADPGSPIG